MKIYNFEQRSLEWYAARAGVITASEIDALVSPTLKVRDSKGVDSYLAKKLAERWIGGATETFQSDAMEYGLMMEQSAFNHYAKTYNANLTKVGFITDDTGHFGCSPDALIGDAAGLEIKCPNAETHVGYLLAGTIPPAYIAQVQFSLYVTGRRNWVFMSYRPGFPTLLVDAEPDAKAFAAFDSVLTSFIERLDCGYTKLSELNGGEPDRNLFREQLLAIPTEKLDASDLENTP